MNNLKININGKEIITTSGKTILDVINEHKIDDIPTLCYDPRITPYGSCYLCVVEVEGLAKLVPSCCSPVNNGMVIHTNNERIKKARKMALELLLSNHYADCFGPCSQTCPAGVDIQGYVSLISMEKYKEAVRLIKRTNPLPLVCGRVCVRECEVACRRSRIDEAVGIDYLKRYAADIDIEDPWKPDIPEKNSKKIAIVGGGPSGLTCAYYSVLKGYSVTLFEKLPELGGMLRYGIPEYRMPKHVLDREIKWITDLGVEVKTNRAIGKDFTIDSLFNDGYNAIYLALGAQKSNKMRVPEEETTEGVIGGVNFLRDAQLKGNPDMYGTVVVVGGGNTAIDAARSSLRCGAKKVIILYRRTRKEMPANNIEIEAALEEGVEIIFLSAPVKFTKENGKLKGVECIRMELGEPDASGRRSPVPKEGSEYILDCDFVISAIGQAVDLEGLKNDTRLKTTKWNTVDVNKGTFETSIPGVFAGGDVMTGPDVAIEAIAHGKMVSEVIDEYIKTGKATPKKKEFVSCKDIFGEIPASEFEDIEKTTRQKMPELPVEERIKTFEEVETGFTKEQVSMEISRCLACGCTAVFDCKLKKYASELGVDISRYIGDVRKYKIDGTHPFITLDPNKCIACGRCVRTCTEILNVSALGFVHRGFKSIVKPAMEKELLETTCISCGNCIDTCPTGAINESSPFIKHGPWIKESFSSICNFCSVGCNVRFDVVTDDIFSVTNPDINTHNKGYLCVKGKFGHRYLLSADRIVKPGVKENGELKNTSWGEAFDTIEERVKKLIAAYGKNSIAVFASPKLSNEELYLLQKFVRTGLKTNNIHSFSNLLNGSEVTALDNSFGMTISTTTTDELDKTDVILVMNSDLSEENLIMELKVKDVRKKGIKLVTINSSGSTLTKSSDIWISSKKGTATALLNGLMNSLIERGSIDNEFIQNKTEGFDEFRKSVSRTNLEDVAAITGVEMSKLTELVDMIGSNSNLIIIYNPDFRREKSGNDLKAIGNLLMLKGKIGREGNGLILLRDFANSTGLLDMGVIPDYLPGYRHTEEKIDLLDKLEKNEIKGILVFGEDPLVNKENLKYLSGAEFLMVQDIFLTKTACEADVVLPLSTYIESDGTFTAADRRVQKVNKIFAPKAVLSNWEVIKKIAQRFDMKIDFQSGEDIFNEIKEVNSLYKDIKPGEFSGKELFKNGFPTDSGRGRFSVYETDISPDSSEKHAYLSSEQYFEANVKAKVII